MSASDKERKSSIVITGASSPMGLALVRDLLNDGASNLLCTYYSHGDALMALGTEKDGLTVVRVDLASPKEVESLADKANKFIHPIVGYVHMAGRLDLSLFEDFSLATYREIFAVNVDSFVLLTHRMLPRMSSGSSIVAVASTDAWFGSPASVAYAASKAALISTTKSLAVALGQKNIRVNTLSPGHIVGGTSTLPGDGDAHLRALKMRGTPADVAGVVNFMLSSSSRYMTGAHIVLDGGASVIETIAYNDWSHCRTKLSAGEQGLAGVLDTWVPPPQL